MTLPRRCLFVFMCLIFMLGFTPALPAAVTAQVTPCQPVHFSNLIPFQPDPPSPAPAPTTPSSHVVVDDYQAFSTPQRPWYYSRIGTDREVRGTGDYNVDFGGGNAAVAVRSGRAGVRTSLMHNIAEDHALLPRQLLGPYVRAEYQPRITGVELDIVDGSGNLTVELKNVNGEVLHHRLFSLAGGPQTLAFEVAPVAGLKELDWLVVGEGHAIADEVRFVTEVPEYADLAEKVFLFSYGHLSQCYDPVSGLVGDRARWPVEDYAAVPATGMFALATAIASELGYVEGADASDIVRQAKNAMLALPRYHGLLPHFITNGDITPGTEWSTVDTAIGVVSLILACQEMGEDASGLEEIIRNVDWSDLSGSASHSISHGYDYSGNKLDDRWDVFGSEAFLVAVAYAAGTGDSDVRLDEYDSPPTWDGSGFNDEQASLFFPMDSMDRWGNDWAMYRQEAARKQIDYFSDHVYGTKGLFGLSASDVPEPWMVDEDQAYGFWGVGGHNGQPNDGSEIAGYPIIAPHYAAMIAAEHPEEFNSLFQQIVETEGVFTPLNNVESLGYGDDGILHWSSLKGSLNLSYQTVGLGRALSTDFLSYRALESNQFLSQGFRAMMPGVLPGDANEDGIIDGRDVIRCKKIILALETETNGADANEDGVVDGRDVIRIKKMILGI